MGVKLVSASGGSVELVAPTTASNFTATMPANTGTVITTASTFAGTGPIFASSVTSNQTISAATWTKVNFDWAPTWGTASNSWDGTNKRFTASVSGYYMFNGCLYATGAFGFTAQSLAVARINNVDEIRLQDASNTTYNLQTNGMVYLSAGEYLEIFVYSSGGATLSSGGSLSWIRGTLVRAA